VPSTFCLLSMTEGASHVVEVNNVFLSDILLELQQINVNTAANRHHFIILYSDYKLSMDYPDFESDSDLYFKDKQFCIVTYNTFNSALT